MSEQEITRENKPERDKKGRLLPGNTANPAGRPEGSISVVSAIKKKLEECPEGKEKTYLHYLVEKIMKKAIVDDDVAMIRDIIDRVDGKPTQKNEHSGVVKQIHTNDVKNTKEILSLTEEYEKRLLGKILK